MDKLLLLQVKTALRIKTDVFDSTELEPLIKTCIADLELSGINKTDLSDPLIKQAVIFYAKANFGYDENSEKYRTAYNYLKNALGLSGEYTEKEGDTSAT